jgi:GNAT superfamily N-acetyltransferase
MGKALMERAERWALERGVSEVELSVWEFNLDAIEFYRELGYATSKRVMHRELTPGEGIDLPL